MILEPWAERDWDDELVFRTLAAPGLEEDDLIAAKSGGGIWGSGRPAPGVPDAGDRDEDTRRARHRRVLERWPLLDHDELTRADV